MLPSTCSFVYNHGSPVSLELINQIDTWKFDFPALVFRVHFNQPYTCKSMRAFVMRSSHHLNSLAKICQCKSLHNELSPEFFELWGMHPMQNSKGYFVAGNQAISLKWTQLLQGTAVACGAYHSAVLLVRSDMGSPSSESKPTSTHSLYTFGRGKKANPYSGLCSSSLFDF